MSLSKPTKVVVGGFKPLPPVYRAHDPSKKHLRPEYPPKSNDFYELTSQARLGDKYWEQKKLAEEHRRVQSAPPKIVVPKPTEYVKARPDTPHPNKSIEDAEKLLQEFDKKLLGNLERGHAHDANQKVKENIRPKGSIFRLEVGGEVIYSGEIMKEDGGNLADEFAMAAFSDSQNKTLQALSVSQKMYSTKSNYDKVMAESPHGMAFAESWVDVQANMGTFDNPAFAKKLESIINFKESAGEINEVKGPEAMSDSDIERVVAEPLASWQLFTPPTPKLLPATPPSPLISEHGSLESGWIPISFAQTPGDCAAFNKRTNRSAADLELSMHGIVLKSTNPNDHAYSPEMHPSSHPPNPHSKNSFEQWQEACKAEGVRTIKKPDGTLKIDVTFDPYKPTF